jgi:hypothetical protein
VSLPRLNHDATMNSEKVSTLVISNMRPYETSTTVEEHGEIRVSGVPFAPGSQVEVTISLKDSGAQQSTADNAGRIASLFAALDRARNTQSVSTFKRTELYDRSVLR